MSVPLLFRSVGGPESAVHDHRMTSANKEGDKRPLSGYICVDSDARCVWLDKS